MKRRAWTPEEETLVRRKYPDTPTAELAEELGRTPRSVYSYAKIWGIKKSTAFLDTPASGRIRSGQRFGRSTEFKPGNIPHNKGLRGRGYAPGRMRETMFKKGNRPANWKPVGTVCVDTEGYLRIKIRESQPGEAGGSGNTRVWPFLHRHTWEQHHGPIPKSHTVVFRDKDRSHCDIGNLECISRAELARRNNIWSRYPKELASLIQLNGALKRKIRRIANGKEQDIGS